MKSLVKKITPQTSTKVDINMRIVDLLDEYYKPSNISNVADLQEIYDKTSLQALFEELNEYVMLKSNHISKIEFDFRNDTIYFSQKNETVYLSHTISSAFFTFVLLQFYQSYLIDNDVANKESEHLYSYRYTLFILNEMCFSDFGMPVAYPDDESQRDLMSRFIDKQNILNISSDMFFVALAFVLLHEFAHIELRHDENDESVEKEYEADALAYKTLLSFIEDVRSGKVKSAFSECFSDYVLLAPMVVLEFYYIVNYTGSFLSRGYAKTENFDLMVKRKEALFDVFYSFDGDMDENEAYGLYNAYVDGQEYFLRSFVASHKAGLLDDLIEKNLRMVEENEE